MQKQNIVVVGGGACGVATAHLLSAKLDATKYNLILITPRDHYIHLIAALRTVVTSEGALENSVLIPYDKNFVNGNGKLKLGTVTAIEEDTINGGGWVTLADNERISYKYLVLTPGNEWEGPLAFPTDKHGVVAFIKDWRKKFANATEIATIGGGAVGIELAGELRDLYPSKKITIVHAGRLLLNDTYPDSFRKKVEASIRARGVDVILDDRIDEFSNDITGGVKTLKGTVLRADLLIPTRGGKPNTGFLTSIADDVLTKSGHVKVSPTLQLESHPHIFAGGDVTNYPEQKQFAKYGGHASVIVTNILSLLAEKPAKKRYNGTVEVIFVTNGRNGGKGYLDLLWGINVGDWVVRTAKSKGLFISTVRKAMGYTE